MNILMNTHDLESHADSEVVWNNTYNVQTWAYVFYEVDFFINYIRSQFSCRMMSHVFFAEFELDAEIYSREM